MMSGTVNARHEILILVRVRNAAGQEQEVEAILDTGFTRSLTLPSALLASLGLPWRSRGNAVLANGNVEQFDIYAATVVWDGMPRQILVQAIDTAPLLGMALLAGYDLRVRVTAGGSVQIEAIPQGAARRVARRAGAPKSINGTILGEPAWRNRLTGAGHRLTGARDLPTGAA